MFTELSDGKYDQSSEGICLRLIISVNNMITVSYLSYQLSLMLSPLEIWQVETHSRWIRTPIKLQTSSSTSRGIDLAHRADENRI